MNDPYMPLEANRNVYRSAVPTPTLPPFPLHIITKSDLVLKDLDTLCVINRIYAAVSFTITTADDDLGKKLEPGAPCVSERLAAMKILTENGILTGVTLMPVLPFIEDNVENIRQIVTRAHEAGASYIIPSFGMSLRDRQRDYYYHKLDKLFPGLRGAYERRFGNQYRVPTNNASELGKVLLELCDRYQITTRIPQFAAKYGRQIPLFN